jgi:hypothetical protein
VTFSPTSTPAGETTKETTPTETKETKEPTPSPVCVNGRDSVRVGDYEVDYSLAVAPFGFPRMGGYKISSGWEQRHQIGSLVRPHPIRFLTPLTRLAPSIP